MKRICASEADPELSADGRNSSSPAGFRSASVGKTRCHVAPGSVCVNEAAAYTALACLGEGIVRCNRGCGGGGDGNGAQMLRA